MFRFGSREHEDSFHRAGEDLRLAKCLFKPSQGEMASWQVLRRRPYHRCSRGRPGPLLHNGHKTHLFLFTRSLTPQQIPLMRRRGGLISINTDIKRLAGVTVGLKLVLSVMMMVLLFSLFPTPLSLRVGTTDRIFQLDLRKHQGTLRCSQLPQSALF